jgi:hypothetical protein
MPLSPPPTLQQLELRATHDAHVQALAGVRDTPQTAAAAHARPARAWETDRHAPTRLHVSRARKQASLLSPVEASR